MKGQVKHKSSSEFKLGFYIALLAYPLALWLDANGHFNASHLRIALKSSPPDVCVLRNVH